MHISVVIPCHNAEAYLAQTIGSVLDQTHPPHEVIVVDDGSTDDSLAVARSAARHANVVKVLAQRSGQAARTRNSGAAVAAGEALMFLDADDVLAPDTLEALAAALLQRPGGFATCPWYRLTRVDGRWVQQPPSCAPRRPGQDPLSAWLTGWYHPPCSVLWSREAFELAGRWDERWNPNDDGDLVMRALVFDIPLSEGRKGAGYYRRIPDGGSSLSGGRFTRDGAAARIRTLTKIAFLLDERGRLPRYRPALREAARIIAASAREFPDLSDKLEQFSQRYARPPPLAGVWRSAGLGLRRMRRATHRLTRLPAPATSSAPTHGGEVNFGLGRPPAGTSAVRDAGCPQLIELERPAVSAIIPTYNRAQVLPRALRSVLDQTFPDFEVLVVDDGSIDDTSAVMAACDDPRVRYLRCYRNRGPAAARNLGLRESRGEFVAFLDSDDEWLPEKLARQAALFQERSQDLGLVYTGVVSVFGDGSRRVDLPRRRGDVYREMLLGNVIHGGGSNVMMRRNVVASVGFFDETFAAIEDYDYWLRITRVFEVDFVPDPLIHYYDNRDHDNDMEKGRKSLAVEDNIDARGHLYSKHRREIQRAGVAHRFHLETARRHLSPPSGDLRQARRCAIRAILASPGSSEAYRMLGRTVLPAGLRLLRRGWHAVHHPSRI